MVPPVAVQVDRATASRYEDDFLGTCQEQELRNPPGFTPPIYNVWELHLSCLSQRQITDATGVPRKTVDDWVGDFGNSAIFAQPPSRTDAQPWGSIQHFDVWSFASNAGRKLADLSRVLAPAQEEAATV